jgi:protein O-GlcNAc transferase
MEAIRLQPTFAIAWSNLAGLFMEAGELQKALAYYKVCAMATNCSSC